MNLNRYCHNSAKPDFSCSAETREERTVELNLHGTSDNVLSLKDCRIICQSNDELATPGGDVWDLCAENGGVVDCNGDGPVPESMEEDGIDVIAFIE